jgi:hypothetical protein
MITIDKSKLMYVMYEDLKFYILGLNPGFRSGKLKIDGMNCGAWWVRGEGGISARHKILKIGTVLPGHVVKEAGV